MERLKVENERKEKGKFRLDTSKKALQAWFLTVPLIQIYSQFNKKAISKD